jgi:hypothetical protein
MIKEAIDRVLDLGHIQPIETGGRTWARGPKGIIEELVPADFVDPTPLRFRFLPGFVEYIRANPDAIVMAECLVVVDNCELVRLLTPPNPANNNKRFCYALAEYRAGRFEFNAWHDQEAFIVGLQTRFVETDNLVALRRLASKLDQITEARQADDGMAQQVTLKTGITTVDQVEIQNPIALQPWAIFEDVTQPEGLFILRLRKTDKGPRCCLFEADSDSWRVRAVGHIRDYLRQELPESMRVLA